MSRRYYQLVVNFKDGYLPTTLKTRHRNYGVALKRSEIFAEKGYVVSLCHMVKESLVRTECLGVLNR